MMAANFNGNLFTKNLRIADLNVLLTYGGKRLGNQIADYICDESAAADITVAMDQTKFEKTQRENSHLSFDSCEYIMTGSSFYTGLIDYDGFMLHSSAVIYDGWAYLFSAPCGTGKSTHTSLWCERFGEKAVILNDDKPAVRFIDGRFFAYGTPWSGKSDKQTNMRVPIAAIAFIEQANENFISPLDSKSAVTNILSQTIRPKNAQMAHKLLGTIDKFVKTVGIYKLKCNMEKEAVDVAYEAMREKE